MIKIRLFCEAGISSKIIGEKMNRVAKTKGIEVDIKGLAKSQLSSHLHGTDIVLIGPQIRHSFQKVNKICKIEGVPVEVISNADFGMMNGEKILEFALRIIRNNKFFLKNNFDKL